ncbi:hypothetical protein EON67_06365, partial [archaeon]
MPLSLRSREEDAKLLRACAAIKDTLAAGTHGVFASEVILALAAEGKSPVEAIASVLRNAAAASSPVARSTNRVRRATAEAAPAPQPQGRYPRLSSGSHERVPPHNVEEREAGSTPRGTPSPAVTSIAQVRRTRLSDSAAIAQARREASARHLASNNAAHAMSLARDEQWKPRSSLPQVVDRDAAEATRGHDAMVALPPGKSATAASSRPGSSGTPLIQSKVVAPSTRVFAPAREPGALSPQRPGSGVSSAMHTPATSPLQKAGAYVLDYASPRDRAIDSRALASPSADSASSGSPGGRERSASERLSLRPSTPRNTTVATRSESTSH